jgi:hypothetical protein
VIAGNRLFYCIVGLALLLFVLGFLSIFYDSTIVVGQVRVWQETERPLTQKPATMKPGNRWDAEFSGDLGEQSAQKLSEIFELVGVVISDESYALISIKDPKDGRVGEVIRVMLGADFAGGVKITHIDEAQITLTLGDDETVLYLYKRFQRENEQAMEESVDSPF